MKYHMQKIVTLRYLCLFNKSNAPVNAYPQLVLSPSPTAHGKSMARPSDLTSAYDLGAEFQIHHPPSPRCQGW